MQDPSIGAFVVAKCGAHTVTGIVIRLGRGAFWLETTDSQELRFALIAEEACGFDEPEGH